MKIPDKTEKATVVAWVGRPRKLKKLVPYQPKKEGGAPDGKSTTNADTD